MQGPSRRFVWCLAVTLLWTGAGPACRVGPVESADRGARQDVGLPLVRRDDPESRAIREALRDRRPPSAAQGVEASDSGTPPGRPSLGAGPPPAAGVPPGAAALSEGRIVYELHRAGGGVDLLRLDSGAARPVALTRGPARDLRPRWSPDGTRVAFFREPAGRAPGETGDIWIIGADGSDPRRVTDHAAHDFDPAWMPDGRRIVFTSRRDGDDNLWLLDLDDGSLRQLTGFDGGRAGAPSPAGDGRTVLYSADRMFSWQIWRLDLQSGETERLTGPLPGACNSAWSPATGRFVHMSGGSIIGTDLVSRAPDGSDKTDVGTGRGNNHDPEFSQDGRRLVWVSDRDGNWEIYEAAADGSGERRVTRTPQDEGHPDLYVDGAAGR